MSALGRKRNQTSGSSLVGEWVEGNRAVQINDEENAEKHRAEYDCSPSRKERREQRSEQQQIYGHIKAGAAPLIGCTNPSTIGSSMPTVPKFAAITQPMIHFRCR